MIQNEKFKLIMFLLYTLLFETLVIGGFLYIIFIMDNTKWLLIVMMMMSSAQLKPKHFGLKYKIDKDD